MAAHKQLRGDALLMQPYPHEEETWLWMTAGVTDENATSDRINAKEFSDIFDEEDLVTIHDGGNDMSRNVCVAANSSRKFAAWAEGNPDGSRDLYVAYKPLTDNSDDWTEQVLTEENHYCFRQQVAIATQTNGGTEYVYVAFVDSFADEEEVPTLSLKVAVSSDNGTNFDIHEVETEEAEDYQFFFPGLAINTSDNATAYLVFAKGDEETEDFEVRFSDTDNNGTDWSFSIFIGGGGYGGVSVAAYWNMVLVCWAECELWYAWSDDAGYTWSDEEEIECLFEEYEYFSPRVEMRNVYSNRLNVVLGYEGFYDDPPECHSSVGFASGTYVDRGPGNRYWSWGEVFWMAPGVVTEETRDGLFDPSLAVGAGSAGTWAGFIWSDPRAATTGRTIWRGVAKWEVDYGGDVFPRVHPCNAGNRLVPALDGGLHFAGEVSSHAVAGPVWKRSPVPILIDAGVAPALSVDGSGKRWVVYYRQDTLWCSVAEDTIVPVFCGSNSARPGQPSIAVYPDKDGDDYVANISFVVYDSAASASRVMYAKVKAGTVLLDTLESYASLADSCPCINIHCTDSLFVTYQHGCSLLSRSLIDYSAGTWSQPTADWGGPDTIFTSSGRAPMSFIEGDYLHCVWSDSVEDAPVAGTRVIRSATWDLDGGQFSGWQAGSNPSTSTTTEKLNPVYAGCGVAVWQEMTGSVWDIMAEVRGDTVRLVQSDTDSYHPHAVAESSAASPSIDQVRVSLLWTEGIVFEVDSAVYDTGETRFKACSLNVSNAGSDATESNNGSKLLRKASSDSLFAVYQDADGAVMYAWSADGSAWQRRQCASHGTYPALCADGTGRRWVVYWDEVACKVYARFDSAGTFSSARELCDLQADQCGPISAAGSHHSTTSCAYAAFRRIKDGQVDQLILAKFDAANQNTTAVLEGDQYVHPCVGTEWVSGDSKDHIHLCWENADENEVYYKMTSSTVDPAEAAPSYSWQADYNLSNSEDDSKDPSMHVSDSRVVVAWSEHSTYDVVAAWRDLEDDYDEFEDTVNLSQSAVNSLYPVVYDADSCIVTWEEHSSQGDIDICTSVEFETGFCMVDNAGESRYPHCLFQNKASGDSAIPYVHLIYCEEPEDNYYEVGYKAWNLKAEGGGGGGGQSGEVHQLLTPMLSACRPNPFTGRTSISYQFPLDGPVTLRVFDASGRSVKTLQSGIQRAGKYTVTWDGRDESGRNVANGVYFYRFDAPGFRDVKKAVVMK
ncbi:MAG: T9SS type A sorting domain-containing protein [candidate division WOR-3 bacterium]|nr:MAG: T9SS type A sorting domain-containing protein [candidate division WOR-3 bacterium]